MKCCDSLLPSLKFYRGSEVSTEKGRIDVSVSPIEGIVENGQIRVLGGVVLPENARVYIVVPALEATPRVRIHSPRLAHPEQASDFAKQVLEVSADAKL